MRKQNIDDLNYLSSFKKTLNLISSEHQHQFIFIIILMSVGMIFETLGVGLTIPVIAAITNPELLSESNLTFIVPQGFYEASHEKTITLAMLCLLGVFILKSLFMVYMNWKQARFTCGLQAYISQELFTAYMRKPYVFHLKNNSSYLIRNVITEVSLLGTVINSTLVLISEGLIILGITLLLLYVETLGTIIVISILIISSILFNLATKKTLISWGESRQFHEGSRVKHIQQGIGGAKDAKLLGREEYFLKNYKLHNYASAQVGERIFTVGALPRLWLELLAVVSLVMVVFILLKQNIPIEQIMPLLGMFAGAAFKVLPSANRILNALQQIRYNSAVIQLLSKELEGKYDENELLCNREIKFESEFSFKNVVFTYPDNLTPALNNINLSIKPGEMVGFVGTTGSGKSTLIDLFLGLLQPDKGLVEVDGISIYSNIRRWQKKIGYVPQTIFLTDDSLRRNIAFGLSDDVINDDSLQFAIKAAQLEHFISELPEGLETIIGERGVRLSGGQKQRIGIARALYNKPEILVLDEATSALDVETEKKLMSEIDELKKNKTIIIIAHRLTTIEKCDVVFRVEKGRLVQA